MQNYSFPNVWYMEVRLCSVRKPLETFGNPRKPRGKAAGNPGIEVLGMVFIMPGAPRKPSETFQKSIEKLIKGLDQIYGETPTCLTQTGGSCLRKFNVQMLVESRFRLRWFWGDGLEVDLLAWTDASSLAADLRLTPFAARKLLACQDKFLAKA